MNIELLAPTITARLHRAIDERVFPGCVAGVVTRTGERVLLPLGRQTYGPGAQPVDEGAVFDVASVTKVLPTSTLALMLIDRGMLNVQDPVVRFVPELRMNRCADVTIRHLLTHTLDFGFRLSDLKDRTSAEILDAILTTDFASPPGSRFAYANATSILLGLLVERASGKTLDVLAKEWILDPLGMRRTTFRPGELPAAEIVPTEADPWRGREIRGETHDESAWKLRDRMVAGSAGLFSAAPDLMDFLAMLLAGGEVNGRQFLSKGTIEAMTTNQIPHLNARTGLGWELSQTRFMGERCSPRCIGKTGFTGCSLVCDVDRGVGIVLLANHTWPRRRADRLAIDEVRREVADLVWGAT